MYCVVLYHSTGIINSKYFFYEFYYLISTCVKLQLVLVAPSIRLEVCPLKLHTCDIWDAYSRAGHPSAHMMLGLRWEGAMFVLYLGTPGAWVMALDLRFLDPRILNIIVCFRNIIIFIIINIINKIINKL